MRHGSLETGIGCFDYASEIIGWDNVFYCEINPFGRKILKYYWPNAKEYTDIFTMDARGWRGCVDIITCGFPCQPFSTAGKGKGDKDDRFIWPENMRIFREAQPPFIVAENVPGLLNKHPLVFERVCVDMENEGYEVLPINIPACATEKDHQRQRLFFIAYNHSYGQRNFNGLGKDRQTEGENKSNGYKRQRYSDEFGRSDSTATNNSSEGFQDGRGPQVGEHKGTQPKPERFSCLPFSAEQQNENWLQAATRICRMDDEYARGLDTTTISKSKWREETIRGFGNAIAWEIAYEIFKAIESLDASK